MLFAFVYEGFSILPISIFARTFIEREGGTYDHLGGGFASSLDADSGGEEGKFYVWNEAEVDALLGEKSSDFKRVYNVDAAGNWGR